MRLFSGLLISTLALGTIVTTGCAEHRSRAYDPYNGYGNSGYGSYYGGEDSYYRQWLTERRYNYVEYNRLNRERRREYWEWRNQNNARFRQDQRFHDNQRVYRDNQRVYRNDHDAEDRRGRDYAHTRNGDRDRHRDDKDRHQVRNRNHDKDGDHDRDRDRR
ncbi:MAG TPA: hypothetical protein VGQ12_05720 [Candidatus Angelobacter sp.]|nr:hypothetical protein [Candidatus Angelobacter sp.]